MVISTQLSVTSEVGSSTSKSTDSSPEKVKSSRLGSSSRRYLTGFTFLGNVVALVSGIYPPVHFGLRFSAKALGPSVQSSDALALSCSL